MSAETMTANRRILVVDDMEAIHQDYRKILCPDGNVDALRQVEQELFDLKLNEKSPLTVSFEVDSAFQGTQGLELVRQALKDNRPYALAFVDVRMPPGWDGIETLGHIWKEDPDLQAVLCSAYSDYTLEQILGALDVRDRFVILKKPFDHVEVRQLACTLTEKWNLARHARTRLQDLEAAIAERNHELQNQTRDLRKSLDQLKQVHGQLLQSEKMASIGQLAAGVAHEINNPIGFISSNLNTLADYSGTLEKVLKGFEELLNDCLTPGADPRGKAQGLRETCQECDLGYIVSDLHKLVDESLEGTRRVRQIVADLRDFSHVDNPDLSEEDVNKLLDKTINVAWNELKYKAEVVKEYGQIPAIHCYGGKLGQVFLNLLVNAAQAIKERGRITVRTGQTDKEVWVEVEDTGCGIPTENAGRVFEPFFTTKEVGKGTGMGLHLAYKIIEAHNGRITLQSKVGKGTTFRVELPIAGPAVAASGKEQSSGNLVANG